MKARDRPPQHESSGRNHETSVPKHEGRGPNYEDEVSDDECGHQRNHEWVLKLEFQLLDTHLNMIGVLEATLELSEATLFCLCNENPSSAVKPIAVKTVTPSPTGNCFPLSASKPCQTLNLVHLCGLRHLYGSRISLASKSVYRARAGSCQAALGRPR